MKRKEKGVQCRSISTPAPLVANWIEVLRSSYHVDRSHRGGSGGEGILGRLWAKRRQGRRDVCSIALLVGHRGILVLDCLRVQLVVRSGLWGLVRDGAVR
jgi:hypothetical protein